MMHEEQIRAAQRDLWLEGPAIQAQRLASQMAFHDLSTLGAERLLARDYGSFLAGINGNPVASIERKGRVVAYLSDYKALVSTPHGLQLEQSSVPLRTGNAAGVQRPVDLRLVPVRGGYAPQAPLAPLKIAASSAWGFSVGAQGLNISIPGRGAPGNVVEGGRSILFGRVERDTDAVVTPTVGGVDLSMLLRSRMSPEQFRYRVALPADATLRGDGGGAIVSRDGVTLARIPAPSARDSQGSPIPARMLVVGNELVLKVPHRKREVAYPLLVDPEFVTISEDTGRWGFLTEPRCDEPNWVELYEAELPISGTAPPLLTISSEATWPRYNILCYYPENRPGPPKPPVTLVNLNAANGAWVWSTPLTGPATVEFDDVALAVEASPSHKENEVVLPEFVACDKVNSSLPVAAHLVLEPSECPGDEDYLAVGLTAGMLYTEPVESVTVSARLSVGSVLLSQPWPGTAESEEFGEQDTSAPHKGRCLDGGPVNCDTGNQVEAQTDLSVGGRGLGLHWSRTYNSRLAVKQSSPGRFGYGWTGSYSEHLEVEHVCEKTRCYYEATVYHDNGSTTRFTATSAPEHNPESWIAVGPLVQATLANEGTGYLYTFPNQSKSYFNTAGQLTKETDRDGNTLTMTHNSEGLLESVSDAAGRKLTLKYNTGKEVESVTDPMGHTVKFSYEAGNLATVIEPGETKARWSFKYDSSHEMTTETDGRSGSLTTEYDSSHRVIKQIDPLKRERKWEYAGNVGSEYTVTRITEPNGAVTREEFNPYGLPVSITHGWGTSLASTTTYQYGRHEQLHKMTDPDGHATVYGYNPAGDRTSEVNPDGDETIWEYNKTHEVISYTTPTGEKTTIKREAHGNPEVVERPAPGGKTQITKYKYDSHGDLESTTDPLERTWKYEYDSYGDCTIEADPEGDKRTWEYNEDSQKTATVSPRGNVSGGEPSKFTTKIERDAQGRPLTVTDPLGHTTKYTYDGNGNLEKLTDGNGHKTTYTYDADDELTKVEEPNKAMTETGYDAAGQTTSQTDGSKHTTKYVRNLLEEVTEVVDPLGRKTTKEYDAAGNLKSVTDPAKRTMTYTYDPGNRLTEISYSDGKTHGVKYEYNADGDRTKMIDGTGTSTYTYNQLNRLTESENGHKEAVKYEYDLANEQTKITYPNGKSVTRVFDKAGRLQKVTDWLENATQFAYNADSELGRTTFPTATSDVDKYEYNQSDQMSSQTMTHGLETLASYGYGHDNDNQVNTITNHSGESGEEKTGLEYDANNRLTKIAGATVYEYNAANNPTKIVTGAYKYNADDQLETGPSLTYTYNEVGQRTKTTPSTGPATTYGYNQAANLISVERPKEGETPKIEDGYAYSGDGLRASQTISGTTSYLAWDMTQGVPLILNDGTNSYIYGPDGLPVEQINNTTSTTTYLHHDQAGSTRLLTGSTGTVTGKCSYSAYGIPTCEGTTTTPLGYDGQYTSSDTGLIYMRARVYNPATAQFLSVDPMVGQTHAPYNYAEDNPLDEADPTGLGNWLNLGLPSPGEVAETLNPIKYYEEEIESYENGCGYLASVAHGLEGAVVGALDASGAGEEELGAEAADQGIAGVIKGYTQHGLEQAIERDAGRGVSPSAILDAVRSPLSESVQAGGRTKFVGQNAVVVVNSEGQIVTTYPLNSAGLRGQP